MSLLVARCYSSIMLMEVSAQHSAAPRSTELVEGHSKGMPSQTLRHAGTQVQSESGFASNLPCFQLPSLSCFNANHERAGNSKGV